MRPCASFQTAMPVEQEEAIGAGRRSDSGLLSRAMPAVAAATRSASPGSRLGIGVRPVGQEREMDRAAGIGEIVDLEPLDLLVDRRAGRQQRRDGDQGAQMRRHALPQVEAGQQRRAEAAGDRAIDQHQRRIDRRQKTDQDHRRERPAGDADLREHEQRQEQNDGSRQGDAGDIARDAGRPRSVAASARPGGRKPRTARRRGGRRRCR